MITSYNENIYTKYSTIARRVKMNKNDNVTKHETEIGALLEQIKQLKAAYKTCAKSEDKLLAENQRLKEAIETVCPFCKEDGFDLIGLKYHIETWCDKYHNSEKP